MQERDIKSVAIHGNKSQSARTKALADFKSRSIGVLVATDIAARGLDIDQLPQVVNFELPNVPEDYVHRIGRTGRASSKGMAMSLVSADEFEQLSNIEHLLKQLITRKLIDGYEPTHDLPASSLEKKPSPARKVKPGKNKVTFRQRSRAKTQRRKPKNHNKKRVGNHSHA